MQNLVLETEAAQESLSARRVWIEIITNLEIYDSKAGHSPRGGCGLKSSVSVPPLAQSSHSPRGGCGLKSCLNSGCGKYQVSLSARRVWIEMYEYCRRICCTTGHSPRGGCGLKFLPLFPSAVTPLVTLREEGVD